MSLLTKHVFGMYNSVCLVSFVFGYVDVGDIFNIFCFKLHLPFLFDGSMPLSAAAVAYACYFLLDFEIMYLDFVVKTD